MLEIIELSKWKILIRWLKWRNLINLVIIKFYTDIDPIFWGSPYFITWNPQLANWKVASCSSNHRIRSRLPNRRVASSSSGRPVPSTPSRLRSSSHSLINLKKNISWYLVGVNQCSPNYLRGAPYPARQKVVIFWDFFSLGK